MNQISAFNKTLEYLESCLDGAVDKKQVLHISGYSYALFARVFSIIANVTLSDYLRFRKLTRAAIDLATSNDKIIDIAVKYGYESHNSFATAFKSFHEITPSDVRRGQQYKIFSPLHFSLSIEGGDKMDIKIVKKEAFEIAGMMRVEAKSTMDFGQLWQELIDSKGIELLTRIGSGQDYGACFNMKSESEFSYMAGFDVKDKALAVSEGLQILTIPAGNYAIIPIKGKVPDCIKDGWQYVVSTFLPENGLKHAGTPDLEVYGEGDINSDDYEMQLWVPVEKAKKL